MVRGTLSVLGIVLVVGLKIFSPGPLSWDSVVRLLQAQSEKESAPVSDSKVWVHKQTGFYYCSDSRAYGVMKPGRPMAQRKALETGYRPAAGEYCR